MNFNTKDKKIYIEAGAVDGIEFSKTLHLKDDPNYFGILVEADPRTYKQCIENRLNDRTAIYNAALVSNSYDKKTAVLHLSVAHHACCMVSESKTHSIPGGILGSVEIPAVTIQKIIDELDIKKIDFLYLDVEGYEEEVIRGIDSMKTEIDYAEIELHGEGNVGVKIEKNKAIFIPLMKKFNLKLSAIIDEDGKKGNPNFIFTK